MQEEIENKSITLIINCTKFTGRVLKSAISKYLAHRSAKRHEKRMDKKGAMRIKNIRDNVRNVLDMTGFSDFLTISDDKKTKFSVSF